MNIAGVILAAGASRRMGGSPKALLRWEQQTFLDRLLDVFHSAVPSVVVVIRKGDGETASRGTSRQCRFVENPDADRGQLSSLQCGLSVIDDAEAVAFCPVDFPAVESATMKQLVATLAASAAQVVQPTFESRHGHPVLIRRRVVEELLAAPAGATTRDVLQRFAAHTTYVAVHDAGVISDVDTPEDYRALRERYGLA